MLPDLSIIIVSWNTCDLLRACLSSVFENAADLNLEVFVVDNASKDGSAAMVRERFPQVRIIQNERNVGFAVANNQVLPNCTSELILLLNPDTIIIGSALQELIRFVQHHPETGAVGPRLLHPHAGLRVLGCGNQPTLWRIFTHYSFLSSLLTRSSFFEGIHLFVGKHDQSTREVEWVAGACLLFRKSALIAVGGLCEDWFMYAEDWDVCERLRKTGWKIHHVASATVEHHLGASTEQSEAASLMPVTAGRSYFIKLNNPSQIELFMFDAIRSAGLAARAFVYFLLGVASNGTNRTLWFRRARTFRSLAAAASPCSSNR